MTILFRENELIIGSATIPENVTLRFSDILKIGGGGDTPSWQDIVLSGNGSLTLTNAKANLLNYLKLFGACEQDGTPTPSNPVDIVCNNGVIKYGQHGINIFNKDDTKNMGAWYVRNGVIATAVSNKTWVMRATPNATYYFKHCSYTAGGRAFYTEVENWEEGSVASSMSGTVAVEANTVGSITVSASAKWVFFCFGRTGLDESKDEQANDYMVSTSVLTTETAYAPYQFGIYYDGTVETVEITGNLVDFNETRIDGSTWGSADKTKGFEVYADVYGKSVGDTMFTNANTFGVFVPCKQGESISLDFFDYTPYYSRCLYCEITANRKCNTTPQEYANSNAGVITQKTFTLTKNDSIGFVFEWWINAQQTRNYTKENYTVIKGTTPPTSYIPYFNGGSATAEMLLKVGDYQDVQSVLDGVVTRNVGVKVLDGTENWTKQGEYNRYLFTMNDSNLDNEFRPLSTHFVGIKARGGWAQMINGYLKRIKDGKVYAFQVDSIGSVDEWKQYLAEQYANGTPVIVVYPLATPTTETVTGQHLNIQAGTNIVEITQASIDNLPLEVSYKAQAQ